MGVKHLAGPQEAWPDGGSNSAKVRRCALDKSSTAVFLQIAFANSLGLKQDSPPS